MPRGQKVSPHHSDSRNKNLLVQTSMTFGADVHDPKGSQKNSKKIKFALLLWPITEGLKTKGDASSSKQAFPPKRLCTPPDTFLISPCSNSALVLSSQENSFRALTRADPLWEHHSIVRCLPTLRGSLPFARPNLPHMKDHEDQRVHCSSVPQNGVQRRV